MIEEEMEGRVMRSSSGRWGWRLVRMVLCLRWKRSRLFIEGGAGNRDKRKGRMIKVILMMQMLLLWLLTPRDTISMMALMK